MSDFDWNQARAFHATAETGSLSAGARKLGLTQPTLSRQVAALEAQMGVTLFERVGKRLVLTESGHDLLDHVRAMREAADAMALAASGRSQTIAGRVSISASDGIAVHVLPDIVERIRAEAPQIVLEIVASNALSDLRRREADIAIRHVRPEQPDLIGRLVRETTASLYASPDWVARHGLPKAPADLADACFVGFDADGRFVEHLVSVGLPVSTENFQLISGNSLVVWELVKRGLGLTFMLREVAEQTPGMIRLLPELDVTPIPYWLVTHRELRTSRRIRIVYDILAEELGR